jgi:beta-lactamase class A
MQTLVTTLNALCDGQPFKTRWYLKNLRTGEEADRDGDTVVYSASTRKISILMAVMKEVHGGRMSLDDPFTIEAKYQDNNSGCFQHLRPGFEVTLFDAATMMIIVSDNACTGKIVDIIGTDKLNEYCTSIGMTQSVHRQNIPDPNLKPEEYPLKSNSTSAKDVGHLLDLMVKGVTETGAAQQLGCMPELCEQALEIMSWQKIGKLNQMLPYETKVACKTGRGPAHHHDAGVIYDSIGPLYILAAYTEGVAVDYPQASGRYVASTHVANLSRTCWDALANQED